MCEGVLKERSYGFSSGFCFSKRMQNIWDKKREALPPFSFMWTHYLAFALESLQYSIKSALWRNRP